MLLKSSLIILSVLAVSCAETPLATPSFTVNNVINVHDVERDESVTLKTQERGGAAIRGAGRYHVLVPANNALDGKSLPIITSDLQQARLTAYQVEVQNFPESHRVVKNNELQTKPVPVIEIDTSTAPQQLGGEVVQAAVEGVN
jgi:hypothetical protein